VCCVGKQNKLLLSRGYTQLHLDGFDLTLDTRYPAEQCIIRGSQVCVPACIVILARLYLLKGLPPLAMTLSKVRSCAGEKGAHTVTEGSMESRQHSQAASMYWLRYSITVCTCCASNFAHNCLLE